MSRLFVWRCTWNVSCAALLLGASLWTQAVRAGEGDDVATQSATTTARRNRSPRASAGKPEQTAEQKIDQKALEKKLDQILENQQKILKRFDEVMAELQIVKTRATIR